MFFDATDLHWLPDVGNSYVSKGQQIKVDTPGKENPWRALLGSLLYPTGEGLYTIHERKRHEEVQAHMEMLIQWNPDAFWFVTLDSSPFPRFGSGMAQSILGLESDGFLGQD